MTNRADNEASTDAITNSVEVAMETQVKFVDLKGFIKKDLKFSTPPADLSDGEIADMIIYLRDLESIAKARQKLLGEALQVRHKESLAALKKAYDDKGTKEHFIVRGIATIGLRYEYVVQQRLDSEAIAKEMGDEWIEEHKKPTTFFQARVSKEV